MGLVPYGGKPDASWLIPTAHRDRWREVMDMECFIISRIRGPTVMVIITEDGVVIIVWP